MLLDLAENFARNGLEMVDLLAQPGVGDAVVRAANGTQRARVALVGLLGRDVFLFRGRIRVVGKGVGAAEEMPRPLSKYAPVPSRPFSTM